MSKTTFFELDGKQFKVELIEAKKSMSTKEQMDFYNSKCKSKPVLDFNNRQFTGWIETYNLKFEWQNYLISEARKRGFISGCTIKTATDMDKMKSGRLQLIGLSKLATDGRKSIIIYDNGKWCAEAIPEVKKHFWTNNSMLSTKNWEKYNSLTDDEMEKIKCDPEKYDIKEIEHIIIDLSLKINHSNLYVTIRNEEAKLIREILNDYLK